MASRVVVMTPGPGRMAGEVAVAGEAPRPPGFRTTKQFRGLVERVSGLLATGGVV
jgi:NitT/TauT family transport system ATP-binding protein